MPRERLISLTVKCHHYHRVSLATSTIQLAAQPTTLPQCRIVACFRAAFAATMPWTCSTFPSVVKAATSACASFRRLAFPSRPNPWALAWSLIRPTRRFARLDSFAARWDSRFPKCFARGLVRCCAAKMCSRSPLTVTMSASPFVPIVSFSAFPSLAF